MKYVFALLVGILAAIGATIVWSFVITILATCALVSIPVLFVYVVIATARGLIE